MIGLFVQNVQEVGHFGWRIGKCGQREEGAGRRIPYDAIADRIIGQTFTDYLHEIRKKIFIRIQI